MGFGVELHPHPGSLSWPLPITPSPPLLSAIAPSSSTQASITAPPECTEVPEISTILFIHCFPPSASSIPAHKGFKRRGPASSMSSQRHWTMWMCALLCQPDPKRKARGQAPADNTPAKLEHPSGSWTPRPSSAHTQARHILCRTLGGARMSLAAQRAGGSKPGPLF